MKALYSRDLIEILNSDLVSVKIYVTDIYNVSYILSDFICKKADVIRDSNYFSNQIRRFYFDLMNKQKSVRAVVQKFNSICKALDL